MRLTKEWDWVLKMTGFFFVGSCYTLGYFYLLYFFNHFQIDSQTFPKTTAEIFFYGGYAVYQVATAVMMARDITAVQIFSFVGAIVAFGAYLGVVVVVLEKLRGTASKSRTVAEVRRKTGWFFRFSFGQANPVATAIFGSGALLAMLNILLVASLGITLLYAVPELIARTAADRVYQLERSQFGDGCSDKNATAFCFAVEDATGKQVAQGFVVAASSENVALSDNGRTRVVSMEGRQLVQLDMPVAPVAPGSQ